MVRELRRLSLESSANPVLRLPRQRSSPRIRPKPALSCALEGARNHLLHLSSIENKPFGSSMEKETLLDNLHNEDADEFFHHRLYLKVGEDEDGAASTHTHNHYLYANPELSNWVPMPVEEATESSSPTLVPIHTEATQPPRPRRRRPQRAHSSEDTPVIANTRRNFLLRKAQSVKSLDTGVSMDELRFSSPSKRPTGKTGPSSPDQRVVTRTPSPVKKTKSQFVRSGSVQCLGTTTSSPSSSSIKGGTSRPSLASRSSSVTYLDSSSSPSATSVSRGSRSNRPQLSKAHSVQCLGNEGKPHEPQQASSPPSKNNKIKKPGTLLKRSISHDETLSPSSPTAVRTSNRSKPQLSKAQSVKCLDTVRSLARSQSPSTRSQRSRNGKPRLVKGQSVQHLNASPPSPARSQSPSRCSQPRRLSKAQSVQCLSCDASSPSGPRSQSPSTRSQRSRSTNTSTNKPRLAKTQSVQHLNAMPSSPTRSQSPSTRSQRSRIGNKPKLSKAQSVQHLHSNTPASPPRSQSPSTRSQRSRIGNKPRLSKAQSVQHLNASTPASPSRSQSPSTRSHRSRVGNNKPQMSKTQSAKSLDVSSPSVTQRRPSNKLRLTKAQSVQCLEASSSSTSPTKTHSTGNKVMRTTHDNLQRTSSEQDCEEVRRSSTNSRAKRHRPHQRSNLLRRASSEKMLGCGGSITRGDVACSRSSITPIHEETRTTATREPYTTSLEKLRQSRRPSRPIASSLASSIDESIDIEELLEVKTTGVTNTSSTTSKPEFKSFRQVSLDFCPSQPKRQNSYEVGGKLASFMAKPPSNRRRLVRRSDSFESNLSSVDPYSTSIMSSLCSTLHGSSCNTFVSIEDYGNSSSNPKQPHSTKEVASRRDSCDLTMLVQPVSAANQLQESSANTFVSIEDWNKSKQSCRRHSMDSTIVSSVRETETYRPNFHDSSCNNTFVSIEDFHKSKQWGRRHSLDSTIVSPVKMSTLSRPSLHDSSCNNTFVSIEDFHHKPKHWSRRHSLDSTVVSPVKKASTAALHARPLGDSNVNGNSCTTFVSIEEYYPHNARQHWCRRHSLDSKVASSGQYMVEKPQTLQLLTSPEDTLPSDPVLQQMLRVEKRRRSMECAPTRPNPSQTPIQSRKPSLVFSSKAAALRNGITHTELSDENTIDDYNFDEEELSESCW